MLPPIPRCFSTELFIVPDVIYTICYVFLKWFLFWDFFACWCTTLNLVHFYLPLILFAIHVSVMPETHNWTVDGRFFTFNSLDMWKFLAFGGIWVNGSRVVWEEVILVPYESINDIASFPVVWMLWHHWLKRSNCLLHLESSMPFYSGHWNGVSVVGW